MLTSLVYHAFGIVGYFYQSTCFIAGIIIVAIQADHWRLRCSVCKSREIHCRGKLVRRFRTVPIGQKAVYIDLPVQRVECTRCQAVRQVKIQFADEHSAIHVLTKDCFGSSKHMTIQAVAHHLGAGFYLPEKSCCQNSILGDKKEHAQRNSVCACLPIHLKPESLLGST